MGSKTSLHFGAALTAAEEAELDELIDATLDRIRFCAPIGLDVVHMSLRIELERVDADASQPGAA